MPIVWAALCRLLVEVAAHRGVQGAIFVVSGLLVKLREVGWEETWRGCREAVFGAIAEIVNKKTGLVLDPADPLSDASMSQAITNRANITITSIYDKNKLINDLHQYVAGRIEEKTTIRFTNLLSVDEVRRDAVRHVNGLVGEDIGVDLLRVDTGNGGDGGGVPSVATYIKQQAAVLVLAHLKKAARRQVGEKRIVKLLELVDRAERFKDAGVAGAGLGIAAAVILSAYAEIDDGAKYRVAEHRRRIQNRQAQQRFRERHGRRMQYNPIGKSQSGDVAGG